MDGIGNDLKNYIVDLCKLDAINTTDDLKIGKKILDMTRTRYGLIKDDYQNVDGLFMLSKGKYYRLKNISSIKFEILT